ncbi:hypothetical protein D3C76_1452440 [compost metagenome]
MIDTGLHIFVPGGLLSIFYRHPLAALYHLKCHLMPLTDPMCFARSDNYALMINNINVIMDNTHRSFHNGIRQL